MYIYKYIYIIYIYIHKRYIQYIQRKNVQHMHYLICFNKPPNAYLLMKLFTGFHFLSLQLGDYIAVKHKCVISAIVEASSKACFKHVFSGCLIFTLESHCRT